MITRSRLIRIADDNGVAFKTVERDYVLTQALADLFLSARSGGLVFKGGTLLRACYFEDYRYSADLDFSLLESGGADAAMSHVSDCLPRCRDRVGFEVLELVEVTNQTHISYRLPGGRNRRIKLNISADEVAHEPIQRLLIPRYADVPEACRVVSYSLVEVAGEKLRCVMQRRQCRDLYDLHHLLVREGVDLDESWRMFGKKAREKQIDPGGFADALSTRMPGYKAGWDREMAGYVPNAPHFEVVERHIRRILRPHLS